MKPTNAMRLGLLNAGFLLLAACSSDDAASGQPAGIGGTSGSSGSSGLSGTSGTSGTSGANGSNGSNGSSGAAGTSGASAGGAGGAGGTGNTGGTSGVAGADGASGTAGNGGSSGAGPGSLPYMVGIKTNGSPTGPASVEGWLGRPIDIAGTTINTEGYIGGGQPYTRADGTFPLLEVSFPLLSIFGESNHLDDLGEAASGAYDDDYTHMAEALAGADNELISVRIGWEFNGNWYDWSNGVKSHSTYENYIAAFKRAAAIVRSKNPNVLVQWCVAWGQPDPTPYWPGTHTDDNPGGVDVVSIDFYQANISHYNNGDQTSPWALAQTVSNSSGPIVLDWLVPFAQEKHVKIALSEYGAGKPDSGGQGSGAGLDDGPWTAASITWMNGLPPGLFLWTMWSSDAPADDITTAGANPNEQAAWVSAWGGTHFGGSWWTGTAPP